MISIRNYLLRSLIVASLGISLLTCVFIYFNAAEGVNELYDKNMQEMAKTLQSQLPDFRTPDKDGRYAISTTRWKLKGEEEFLIQLWKKDTLYYSSHPIIDFPLQPADARRSHHGLSIVEFKDRTWLVYQVRGPEGIVQISQPKHARSAFTREIGVRMLIPILLQIPLLCFLIWIAVGKSLRPLNTISREISARTATSLTPVVSSDIPLEIQPMVQELNALIARLGTALVSQRRFVADAAHELRTPLTALQLQLGVLERARSDQERQGLMVKLQLGIERATHLVRQLLTLARLEPEAVPGNPQAVALAPILRNVIESHAEAAAVKQIDLGASHLEDITIHGDAESMRILLSNLVDNALRFTPTGGKVSTTIYRDENGAVIEVEDNGIGIPEEARELVFQRFHRVLGTNVEGTGLGLAIVRNIVEHHQGTIAIRTARAGTGTLVQVRLP